RLIDCVKKREAIWNVKSKSYRILSQKEEKWKEIAKELNTTVDHCKTRYKTLRDRYSREAKKRKGVSTGSGADDDGEEWLYYNQLDFLKNSLRRSRTRYSNVTPKTEDTSDYSLENDDSVIMTPLDDPLNSTDPSEQQNHQQGYTNATLGDNPEEKFSNFVENANSFLTAYSKRTQSHSFFAYLEEKMKRLPQDVRDSLEMEFLQRVHEELQKLD
uniref:Uncharacterized protein n=1 Tax=Phlebotomus papatasi TaxID=29031 RepID=A0A1B0D812_PHLPP